MNEMRGDFITVVEDKEYQVYIRRDGDSWDWVLYEMDGTLTADLFDDDVIRRIDEEVAGYMFKQDEDLKSIDEYEDRMYGDD